MHLYHHPFSANARKTVMTALLLDVDVELVLVDLRAGDNQKAEYLALNPMGKVPTLVDGDRVLWESHAIMQYLADQAPADALYPTDRFARADVNRWLFWSAAHWSTNIALLVQQHVIKRMRGEGEPDPSIVALGEREVVRFGKVLDDHLAERNYLCGTTLTLADLAVAAPLMYTGPGQIPVRDFANIQKWFGWIQELEVWRKTIPTS